MRLSLTAKSGYGSSTARPSFSFSCLKFLKHLPNPQEKGRTPCHAAVRGAGLSGDAGDDHCGVHLLDPGDRGGLDGQRWEQGQERTEKPVKPVRRVGFTA